MNTRQESHIEKLPTVAEELERKVFEQLERLVIQLENGQITDAQFDTGVMTIWHCVSGLVSNDLMNVISAAKAHGDGGYMDNRVFTSSGVTMIVKRKVGGSSVSVYSPNSFNDKERVYDLKDERIPSKAAKQKQEDLTRSFIYHGWKMMED